MRTRIGEITVKLPCTGKTDLFFPTRGTSSYRVEEAKAICEGCPWRWPCLQRGMYEDSGIWGGLSSQKVKTFRRKVKAGLDPKIVLERMLKQKITWVPEQSSTADASGMKKSETVSVG